MLGSLIVLYWLYMGSQSRFYARWMLPLYPALAILAAYALTQIRRRSCSARWSRSTLIPTTLHDGPQRARARPRGHAHRDPRLARGERPAGHEGRVRADRPDRVVRGHARAAGRRPTPRRQWERFNRSQAIIAELGARLPRRALPGELPELRAHAHARADRRLPARGRLLGRHRLDAVRPRAGRALPRAGGAASTTARCAARPTSCSRPARSAGRQAAALPGRQVVQLRRRAPTTGPVPK